MIEKNEAMINYTIGSAVASTERRYFFKLISFVNRQNRNETIPAIRSDELQKAER